MSEKVHAALKARLKNLDIELKELRHKIECLNAEAWRTRSKHLRLTLWKRITHKRLDKRQATTLYNSYG